MKNNCWVTCLTILIHMMDLQGTAIEEETVLIGDPFHYYKCNNSFLDLRLNGMKDINGITVGLTYDGIIKLDFEITYEFDDRSLLKCTQGLSTILNIEHRGKSTQNSDNKMEQMRPKVYNYAASRDIAFQCNRTREPTNSTVDSLHWILLKDANTVIDTTHNYINYSLTYSKTLNKEHDGMKLVCFYFKCDTENYNIMCTREVIQHVVLKLTNDNSSTGFQTNDDLLSDGPRMFVYAITCVGALVLTLAAVAVWYYRRKEQKGNDNLKVEYCEIGFSIDTQTPLPVKKDEIIYSKVKGVLLPAQNTIPNPPLC